MGNASQYQTGRELTRTLQVGFDSYPQSGDFTGVRPVSGSVSAYGTTGVPCAQVWLPDSGGVLVPTTGSYASWLIQPFTPTESGYAELVSFVAQSRISAGYSQGTGKTMYLGIYQAATGTPALASWTPQASVNIASASQGKKITVSLGHTQLVAGRTYWMVFAPLDVKGAWNSTGLDYANLNWMWRAVVSDSAKVGDVLYNNNNGSGAFTSLENRAIGVRIVGYAQPATEKSVGDAKNLAVGTPVTFGDVPISGNGGAVGPNYFYVQSPDRTSGIRVIGTTSLPAGEHVRITGTITTVGMEKAINADDIAQVGLNSPVGPVGIRTSSVSKLGPDTVGLLVRLAGNVTSASGNEFTISDGAQVYDWDTMTWSNGGIICRAPAGVTIPTTGSVGVTGIVSLQQIAGSTKAVVLIRNSTDIRSF